MKSCIVLLPVLIVLAAGLIQTVNVPVTLFGNANGSVTVSAGNLGSVTLSSDTKSAVQGLLGMLQTALGTVRPGSQLSVNVPIAINGGTATVVVNGKPYVVDAATIGALATVLNKLSQAFSG